MNPCHNCTHTERKHNLRYGCLVIGCECGGFVPDVDYEPLEWDSSEAELS